MQKLLKLGTRGSALALAQAQLAKNAIEASCKDIHVEICVVHTSGDKDRVRSLVSLGGSGIFVKELEESLLDGRIDFAVHSLKDVPVEMDSRLYLCSFLQRTLPYDVLVSNGCSFSNLKQGALVGTGSPRRILQLRAMRPDLRFVDLRGNLGTRIERVSTGALDAILLGGAGLLRLGLSKHISDTFLPHVLTPAIGQGIIAIQSRKDDTHVNEVLLKVNNTDSEIAARMERAWMKFLGGGCRVPMAAFLELSASGGNFYTYLAEPSGKAYFRAVEHFKRESLKNFDFGNFGENFIAECVSRKIPLPRDVDEHALLDFWGNL